MSRSYGLTLIEVIIGIAVVSIGLFALMQVMTIGMRASSTAEQIRTATAVAESELDYRQQTNINSTGADGCESSIPDGYSCEVVITPCELSGGDFVCADDLPVTSTVAYRFDITTATNRGHEANLTIYLAKALQAVGTDNDEDTGGG